MKKHSGAKRPANSTTVLPKAKKSKARYFIAILFCLFCGYVAAQPASDVDKKQFRFFINADPQMGPQNTKNKGLKILNELLEKFVAEVNRENHKKPIDFVLYNGDLVWDPYQDAFDNFTRIVKAQQVPTLLVHGNHDGYDNDPKFFEAQQALSGYQKLNYSFDYGNWHMVVIGAQEKYLHEEQKQKQLQWIKDELTKHKDRPVMLFMHYHIMPIGLSQMEFYTYWPMTFKNQMLDIITEHGNVKYVFSGHVHSGVKASVKSSLEFKGTKFINCPTPVMARPFGEEFSEYESGAIDRYFRRGFFLEVVVDGDQVELIGRKIDHHFTVKYPNHLKQFRPVQDPRFFTPEARTKARKKLHNPSFDKKFKGWKKSYRYKKDKNNAFKNTVKNGQNILQLNAPWGSWSFDEYMESYQLVNLDLRQPAKISYQFKKPVFSKQGAGGYLKFILYNNNHERDKMILLHWGNKEEKVKFMYQAWLFNADGDRSGSGAFASAMKAGNIISIPLHFDSKENQVLDLDLKQVIKQFVPEFDGKNIKSISIAHGVWSKIMMKESRLKSRLVVDEVGLQTITKPLPSPIMLNNHPIPLNTADRQMPYYIFH